MREFLRYLFVVAAMLMVVVGDVWAECYVLNDANGGSFSCSLVGGVGSYTPSDLTGPGHQLYFEASKSMSTAVGDVEIQQYVNGGWTTISSFMPEGKNSFKSYGPYTLDRNATKIRFYNGYGSYKRSFQNIKVTQATYADQPSATSWTADTKVIDSPDETKTITMAWSNTAAFSCEITGDGKDQFTAEITEGNASTCSYGTAKILIKYKHNVFGTHNASLKISNGTYTYNIALSGTTLPKQTVFSWNLVNEYLVGDEGELIGIYNLKDLNNVDIKNDLHSAIEFVSTNSNVVAIEDGKIKAKNEGVATISAIFLGKNGWENFNKTITLNIRKRTANFAWTLNEPSYHVDDYAELINIYTLKDNATGADVLSELHSLISFESDDSNIVSVKQNSEGKRVVFAENAGEAKVTANFGGNYKWNAFTAELPLNIIKYTPEFTWNVANTPYYYGSSIPNVFSTTNTDAECLVTFTSDNEAFAHIENNTLYIANLNETATITVDQKENYKWYGLQKTYFISPVNGNTHVRIEINDESEYNLFKQTSTSGSVSWDGGVKFTQGAINWDDSYYDIRFEGIPDKLTFDYDAQSGASGKEWHVYEKGSVEEEWVSTEWSSNGDKGSASISLRSSSRYVRFCYSGNLSATIKNIVVTEKVQFEATPNSLDFGTQGFGYGSQNKTVTFLHANAGRLTTAVIEGADQAYFSVDLKDIPGTGRDLYGTALLNVNFDNRGDIRGDAPYNAVLVISDNANPNHRIEIPLTGVRDGKSTPEFVWNPNALPYYFNTTIANIVYSTNKDPNCPLTFETSDSSVAEVVDGKLKIYDKGQEVTITVRQSGNENYLEHFEEYTFTPCERPSLEVPFRVSRDRHMSSVQIGSKCDWVDDAQFRLSTTNISDGFVWEDDRKRVLFTFGGVPDKLYFDYKASSGSTAQSLSYSWMVEESTNGVDWSEIWRTSHLSTDWSQSGEIDLNPSTQYVRISYTGNFAGYVKDIIISSLEGHSYLRAEEGSYLSRGAKYGTQAVADPFGVVCRISHFTLDNIEQYSRFQFIDNMQYLWETEDTEELFTDDKTAANTANLWHVESDASGKFTMLSGNETNKRRYVTIKNNVLTFTDELSEATIWHTETPSEHEQVLDKYMDEVAAWAASKDFGSEINTLEQVRSNIDVQDFEKIEIAIPAVALAQQNGEYRDDINGTLPAYDNMISGLEPGLYRLTVKAFYRISEPKNAKAARTNNWESVLAYVYANDVKYPIQSIYESHNPGSYHNSDELYNGYYYPTQLQNSADKALTDANRYLNDVYVYVGADAGQTTGTLRYGIKNPSYVPGAWLVYGNFTLTRIARKEYIFEGTENSDPKDWNSSGNWNRESVPNQYHKVTIKADANITLPFDVYSLSIDEGKTVHITSDGGLTIGRGGAVNVNDGAIIVDNTPEGAGYLRIDPNTTNKLTNMVEVKYTTKAYDGVWQYFGAPGTNATISNEPYTDVYLWSEPQGWLQHTSQTLQPFEGYAITQYNSENQTYSMTATPICGDKIITLTKSADGMNGDNLFVNSYLAPIDLTKFTDMDDELNDPNDDFRGDFEKTFYLFNSGSWEDWQDNGGSENNGFKAGDERGQYFAITPLSVKLLDSNIEQTVIPSMQGVYVIANENGASIKLDYNKHVYKADAANMNYHMRAPKVEDKDFMRVRMQVGSQNSGADRMYVIQYKEGTRGFDNGYDAKNILADGLANIYTSEQDGQMEISVSDNIDETYIGFVSGNDSEYTLRFTSVVGELYLKDLETETVMAVMDGEEYTFHAEPNSVNDRRFLLLDHMPEQGGVSTGVDNLSCIKAWIADNVVYVTNAPINANLVVYTMSGVVVTSFVITTPYATIDLANMPSGVYMLHLNDKVYKFVCK